mmetsp:Transcript_1721/g.2698  ORF Transcript_1721/g.2698 Transcript_1721/m.2698 type:complete len:86 (-) Transcript_1721:264-521(-)
MLRAARRVSNFKSLSNCNVSELAISRLQMIAERELGRELFDLNGFQGCLVESNSMPLDTLELKVNQWIERKKASKIFSEVRNQCP